MEVHELSRLFPEMPQNELSELVEDISKAGQIDPIITYEGAILDGRHRWKACCILGRAPIFEEWKGQGHTPLQFVVSRNLRRRNLEPGQRAAIALDVKDRLAEDYRKRQLAGLKYVGYKPSEDRLYANVQTIDDPKDAAVDAAKMMGVGRTAVFDAQNIRDASPATLEAVKQGEVTIPDAKRIIANPEVHAAVDAGRMTPVQAVEVVNPKRRAASLDTNEAIAEMVGKVEKAIKKYEASNDVVVSEAASDIRHAIESVRHAATA